MTLNEFLEALVNSPKDLATLYARKIHSVRFGVEKDEILHDAILRLKKHGTARYSYAVWFAKLNGNGDDDKGEYQREDWAVDQALRRGKLKLESLEVSAPGGEEFQLPLPSKEPNPLEALQRAEEQERLEKMCDAIKEAVAALVKAKRIRANKEKVTKALKVFVAYLNEPDASINAHRKELAPEIAPQRISDWYKLVIAWIIRNCGDLF